MNEDPHRDGPVLQVGAPLETAAGAVILLHGRGASAEGTQSLAAHFDLPQPLFAKGMLLDPFFCSESS